MTPRRRRRRGFTLIELLVVISIIGILVGLLLPAINAAREAGRRAKCQSNMRNVVLAILGYVNNKQVFPPSGEFGEDATTLTNLTSNPPNQDPSQSVVAAQFLPGASGAQSRGGIPMYSWVVPILPYLDATEMFNQWTMYATTANGPTTVAYFDPTNYIAGQASNAKISNTNIGVLVCPDDNTIQNGQGNLSYVVNQGYALYQAFPVGWVGSAIDGGGAPTGGTPGTPLIWASTAIGWAGTVGVTQKLGVMFPESGFPQGIQTRVPWNVRTSLTSVFDGASNTVLMSENTLTGVSVVATPYSNGLPTNWACPMPNFTSFIGASSVCGAPASSDCTAGQLAPVGDIDGIGWSLTNKIGTFANINGGQNLTIEGQYPFSNSAHPAGCNMGFCDGGVRFISNTMDGTVYSKIITPAGSKLPLYCKQMPVEQDAFTNN